MQTLDTPIYEVNQDSEWYRKMRKKREDQEEFFKKVKSEYDLGEGFGFYHSEYFGVHYGTKEYDTYKDEVVKNGDKGFHSFKKRSKLYNPIKKLIEQIEQVSPFKSHDTFGLNNIAASQWIGDRWFYGVKDEKHIKDTSEISPIDYKDYLKIVMDALE